MPSVWKSAFISPLHKKGKKSDVTNYRPISILCILAKLFEKIVYNQIYPFKSNQINQTLTLTLITDSMTKGMQIDVVYTDYSKCFDRIDHKLLFIKLERIGIEIY
jgi:hypothetical protein